jgi:hypothetical protein
LTRSLNGRFDGIWYQTTSFCPWFGIGSRGSAAALIGG